MHKDAEEMEAICQCAVRDGGLRLMFTDHVNNTQNGSGIQSSGVLFNDKQII